MNGVLRATGHGSGQGAGRGLGQLGTEQTLELRSELLQWKEPAIGQPMGKGFAEGEESSRSLKRALGAQKGGGEPRGCGRGRGSKDNGRRWGGVCRVPVFPPGAGYRAWHGGQGATDPAGS